MYEAQLPPLSPAPPQHPFPRHSPGALHCLPRSCLPAASPRKFSFGTFCQVTGLATTPLTVGVLKVFPLAPTVDIREMSVTCPRFPAASGQDPSSAQQGHLQQSFPLQSAAPEREKPHYKTLQNFLHQIFLSYFLSLGGWEGS